MDPAEVVMGIGAKPERVLDMSAVKKCALGASPLSLPTSLHSTCYISSPPCHGRGGIKVIRRFTGGGTVIVDKDTVFASFVCNQDSVPSKPAFPRDVMRWSESFYAPVFERLLQNGDDRFALLEHDYCVGERKIGGNAQSLSRNRWVHHTSFLWNYCPDRMRVLTLPEKRPEYRGSREHHEFLVPLRELAKDGVTPDDFLDAVAEELGNWFEVEPAEWEEAEAITQAYEGRRSNRYEDV